MPADFPDSIEAAVDFVVLPRAAAILEMTEPPRLLFGSVAFATVLDDPEPKNCVIRSVSTTVAAIPPATLSTFLLR